LLVVKARDIGRHIEVHVPMYVTKTKAETRQRAQDRETGREAIITNKLGSCGLIQNLTIYKSSENQNQMPVIASISVFLLNPSSLTSRAAVVTQIFVYFAVVGFSNVECIALPHQIMQNSKQTKP